MIPNGLMISAPSSGTGKTTVMLGLLRALANNGLIVQPFKSGPDYIDPAFHQAAARRPSYNLDSWAMDNELLNAISAEASGADITISEGSMGLYDGVATKGANGYGSSAETAMRMGWPVILVIDVSGQAQSAAATALGFMHYTPALPFAGVILNRVASPRHERLARRGMEKAGIEVLGVLPRRGDLVLPERHLGLIQAIEHPDLEQAIKNYAAFLNSHLDIEAIRIAAKGAHKIIPGSLMSPPAQKIAIAKDAAFSFTYPHLLKGWRTAGAEILPFSPLANDPIPDADLVWLPGGYPELHPGVIASANKFLTSLKNHAMNKPVHGECGGYMVLGEGLIDKEGIRHKMAGLLGLVTSYENRKLHLGYRKAAFKASALGFKKGTELRGHEFHYSTILDEPDQPLADVFDADGNTVIETGSVRGHVTGTFFHMISEVKT